MLTMRAMRAALFSAAIAVLSPVVASAERPFLFHDAFVNPQVDPAPRTRQRRHRFVQPDLSSLASPDLLPRERKRLERFITANLFSDVMLPVELRQVERDGAGNTVWTGVVEGQPGSSVIIASNGLAMTATVALGSRRFRVSPSAVGAHEAMEFDGADYAPEAEPVPVIAAQTATASVVLPASAGSVAVDVLVAYTNVVRQGYGTEAAVLTLIGNAVASTNTAYANSGVTMRLSLVGTMEVAYDDRAVTFSETLSRLTNTSDGFMDDVHARRTTLGADSVGLLVWQPTDSNCGIGWLMSSPPRATFKPYAFNVTRDDCAVDNLSFAHELGHNFGLAHDRANASGSTPSQLYAYGFQDTMAQFRDIMAYNCASQNCPRVTYFSNPEVTYLGRPFGVNYLLSNSADNVRALNANASVISGWYPTAVTPVSFTDDPLVAQSSQIKAVHITELRTAINSLRTSVSLPIVTSWTDPTLAGIAVRAVHITELRNALTPAVLAQGRTAAYTDANLANVPIKAVHIQELRTLVR